MMYKRAIKEIISHSAKSVLLLGPRQTGKSTLLKSLKPDLEINLANESTFIEFSGDPTLLKKNLDAKEPKTIFIDEVQRLPSLLNTLQAIIDENRNKYKFYLSGSSARKLRRGEANLLPGRILYYEMTPLLLTEIPERTDIHEILSTGLLPGIYTEENKKDKQAILNPYAGTYLAEEIKAEALTKNIEGFSRFLKVAATKNAEYTDFAKMGVQAQINQKTASRFFDILEDTLIAHRLDAFAKSATRRFIRHPRYYFFDTGVLNALLGNFKISSDRIGPLFETLIFNQVTGLLKSMAISFRASHYRTESGAEVDLILEVGDEIYAIEIKATKNIGKSDLRGLQNFEDFLGKKVKKYIVFLREDSLKINDVMALSPRPFLEILKKQVKENF